jgi:hypothetical protein
MEAYWKSGGIDPRILDLGTKWMRVVVSADLPPGKEPLLPIG